MGSMKEAKAENGAAAPAPATNGGADPPTSEGEKNTPKRGRSVMSGGTPIEVGTRVMCRWRDQKPHPVKVIERRKILSGGPNDYEYYVHYTECKLSFPALDLCVHLGF